MKQNKFLIRIFDEVNGDSAISVDDGDLIFKKIDNALSQSLSVELDFQNINLIITAFLNAAIGQLYSKYNSEQLNEKLKLKNIKPEDVHLFKKVIERAKEYFENPKGFEDSIKE
ncbi:MAG: hypothetical protein A2046_12820 [Bacteroidetes bacterium GWA2_30_7]|nr:MAG: hypothetical protein A2046_12820 [Bacteroidetes bacterium GWA2_30_7]